MRQYLIPVLLITGLTLFALHFYKNNDIYNYDEADYKYAAEKGIIANYLDQNTLPLKTFYEAGTNLGRNKSKRTELSELIRSSDDISFYRHFHGPLYSYWLNIIGLFGARKEESFRAGTLLLLGFIASLLFWAGNRIHHLSIFCAFLPVILLFGSEMNILTAAILTPHAIYCLTSLAALILLAKFLATMKIRDWYIALVALCFALLSIEYAILIVATFIISLFFFRKAVFTIFPVISFTLRSLGVLVSAITIFWLGGIIKLTLIKDYLFFAYFTLIRGGEYGTGSFIDAWSHRFADSPVICTVALATIVFFLFRLKNNYTFLPYLLYPLLVIISSLRNTSTSPTYVSSIFPPVFLLTGIAFFELSKEKKRYIQIVTIIIIGFLSGLFLKPPALTPQGNKDSDVLHTAVRYFRANNPDDSSIVVPRVYLPTLHYYFQDKHFSGYAEEFDDSTSIEKLFSGNVNGFLYTGTHPGNYVNILQKHYLDIPDTLHDPEGNIIQAVYYRLRSF